MNKQFKMVNGRKVNNKIEWADYTFNPIAGCLHGCEWIMPDGAHAECYAKTVADKFGMYENGFEAHTWKPELLAKPSKVTIPSRIFVGSMADVFGHWVPEQHIEDVLLAIRSASQHQFQMLTKNPVRAKQFDLPGNVWLGASVPPDVMWGKALSVAQRERMLRRSLASLMDVEASVRWMSFEPLSWDVSAIVSDFPALDWAVIGAASNGRKEYPPSEAHTRDLIDVLDAKGTSVFFKGNMRSLTWAQNNWREEFPR